MFHDSASRRQAERLEDPLMVMVTLTPAVSAVAMKARCVSVQVSLGPPICAIAPGASNASMRMTRAIREWLCMIGEELARMRSWAGLGMEGTD